MKMAKGLIGRHLNDYSTVLNMEGVWKRPQREHFEIIAAPDRWMTSLALTVSFCELIQEVYINVCLSRL